MELTKWIKKIQDYGILVMFTHTIFSLSFAMISMLLAARGLPSLHRIFWILLAFLSSRTGANALNRLIDAEIDSMNPRTKFRQLPQGLISRREVLVFSLVCFALLVLSAGMLNPLCLLLSPLAIFLMTIYSYTKRFTFTCHIILGITSASAPVGAWLAITGKIDWLPLFIGAANTLWVAGFDIIYGAQDYEFDRLNGLHSIPVTFGVKYGLYISSLFHFMAICSLILVGLLCGTTQLGLLYYVGLAIISILLIIEHRIVTPDNLTHAKFASYSINQLVSVLFLIFGMASVMLHL